MKRTLLVAILGLLIGGAVVHAATDRGDDERTRELKDRVAAKTDSLRAAELALQVVDSTAAVEIRQAQSTRVRQDTVFQASVDTIRAALPDTLRPALDRLVRADSLEDAAYEAEIAALEGRIEVRDSVIARLEAQAQAQAELVAHLEDRLDPPFLERAFGGVGEGAARVGVIAGAVLLDEPTAAVGMGAMWAVDVTFQ